MFEGAKLYFVLKKGSAGRRGQLLPLLPMVSFVIRYEVDFNICFSVGDRQLLFWRSFLSKQPGLLRLYIIFTAIRPYDATYSAGSLQCLAGKFW